MSRQLPITREPELTAMAVFEPNGAHFLQVDFGPCWIDLTPDQVATLKDKIAAFERASAFEAGRPVERFRRHKEAL